MSFSLHDGLVQGHLCDPWFYFGGWSVEGHPVWAMVVCVHLQDGFVVPGWFSRGQTVRAMVVFCGFIRRMV